MGDLKYLGRLADEIRDELIVIFRSNIEQDVKIKLDSLLDKMFNHIQSMDDTRQELFINLLNGEVIFDLIGHSYKRGGPHDANIEYYDAYFYFVQQLYLRDHRFAQESTNRVSICQLFFKEYIFNSRADIAVMERLLAIDEVGKAVFHARPWKNNLSMLERNPFINEGQRQRAEFNGQSLDGFPEQFKDFLEEKREYFQNSPPGQIEAYKLRPNNFTIW
jgi:hypothetical protein